MQSSTLQSEPIGLAQLGPNRSYNLGHRKLRGRYAVAIIDSPPGWLPHSKQSMPVEILSATFLVRRISCRDASTVAQGFNRAQFKMIQSGGNFDGRWAVVISPMFGVPPEGEAEDEEAPK